MALTAGSQIATASPFSTRVKAINSRSVSFVSQKRTSPSKLRLNISCLAKPETVEKVAGVVRRQLAIPADKPITGDSTFVDLGADSLDTVEIMMGLEEEFKISVDEGKAEGISTVHQAADMIEKICNN